MYFCSCRRLVGGSHISFAACWALSNIQGQRWHGSPVTNHLCVRLSRTANRCEIIR